MDAQADLLTQREEGGPKGYYLRGVAEQMQVQGRGIVHLGTSSANPMNNAPFLRGNARVDRLTVAGYLKHVYDTYLDWLREADKYTAAQAYEALVAFVFVRMDVQQQEALANATGTRMSAAASLSDLLEALQLWMTEDPEEGARGQALVAATLSLVWDDIEVVPKHHPAPFDVRRPERLACEVKQKAVLEADVLELARRAASRVRPRAIRGRRIRAAAPRHRSSAPRRARPSRGPARRSTDAHGSSYEWQPTPASLLARC